MKISDVIPDEKLPSVPTLTVQAIAHKHGVDVDDIKRQLKMGIEVEYEHSKDSATAKEIALDHLLELPDYYDRLADMEREGEADLDESLDNPYPYRYAPSYGFHKALADLPDGTRLEIVFTRTREGGKITRHKDADGNTFTRKSPAIWEVDFGRDDSDDITGQGDQFRIFATVKAATKEFFDKVNPKILVISAKRSDGASRERLYTRFARMIASQYDFKVRGRNDGDIIEWILVKNNIAEDLDEVIRKVGSQYRLYSKKGKNLGTYPSRKGAEDRERQVQYFKHKG
jgi:hypothetical protein